MHESRRRRIKTPILLILLLISHLIAQPALSQTAVESRYDEALNARNQGDHQEAIRLLESAIRDQQNPIPSLMLLASIEAAQENWTRALSLADKAIRLSPNNADALTLKARILGWQGKYYRAERQIARVFQLQPDYLDAWILKARIAWYQEDAAGADTALQTARELAPDNHEVLIFSGDVRRALGDTRGASAFYEKALRLYPDSKEAAAALKEKVLEDRRWHLSLVSARSELSRLPMDDWTSHVIEFGSQIRNTGSWIISLEQAERFTLEDEQLQASIYQRMNDRLSAYLMLGSTREDDFLPARSARTGFTFSTCAQAPCSLLTGSSLDYRQYLDSEVLTLDIWLRQQWFDNRFEFEIKSIHSKASGSANDSTNGWSAKLTASLSDQFRFYAGYADAPESDRGIVTDTKSLFGGIQINPGGRTSFRLDYSRYDREGSYLRKELSAGLTLRF